MELDRAGFESLLCHFLGPIQVSVSVVAMFQQIEGLARCLGHTGSLPCSVPLLLGPPCGPSQLEPHHGSEVGCLLTEGETEAQEKEVSGLPGTCQ